MTTNHMNAPQCIPSFSSLELIIAHTDLDLLPRLKRRQADIRTPRAAERVAEVAAPATARLALHRKVDLRQLLVGQHHARRCLGARLGEQLLVGGCARFGVFVFEELFEAAGAVFAGAAALAGFGGAFWGCHVLAL